MPWMGRGALRGPHVGALALVGTEEESFILNDCAAETAAKLFQSPWIFRGGRLVEIIACVHGSIAAEGECTAVKHVRARFQSDIAARARLPAIFGRGILLNIELLNRIDRQDGG